MKRLIFNRTFLLLTALVATLTSCLKDEGFEDGEYGAVNANTQGQMWVSIPPAARNPNAQSVESKAGFQTVNLFPVAFDFVTPTDEDITVTLAVNNALVAQHDPTALVLPTANFTLPSTTITIPKGQRVSAPFQLSINTGPLDPTKKYGIGLTIASVSKAGVGIPSNLKNVVYVFALKNRYDGVYSLNMRLDGWEAFGIASGVAGNYNANVELITSGPNEVTTNLQAPQAGFGNLQPGFTGGVGAISGFTAFGAATPKYIFDLNTNKVTAVVNTTPDDGRGRAFYLDPLSTTSEWNPTTKQLKVEYFLKQTGRPDMKITAIYTHIKPRA